MKAKLTGSSLALAAVVAASFTLASGCCSGNKGSTAYYSETPKGYGGTASTSEYTTSTTAESSSQMNLSGETNAVIPLYKESLAVGKREVDAGSVRVKKIVKTETVNEPVELRHEEIVIERQPASGESTASSGQAFQEQETVIHLTKEEPVVEKRTTSAGQIVLQSKSSTEQRNVQAQVRSEDVDVVKSGNAENVTIGQGVQSSAMGGAESPSGQSSGTSMGGAITDPTMLSSSANASSLAGRQVQFSNVKVQNVMGDNMARIDAGNGQSLYVFCEQGAGSLKAGDTVSLKGTVKTGGSDLTGTAAQMLSGQPCYIEAQKIAPAGQ